MPPLLVQSALSLAADYPIELGAPPVPGNLLVAAQWGRAVDPVVMAGFTFGARHVTTCRLCLASRRVQPGDPAIWPGPLNGGTIVLMEWSGLDAPDAFVDADYVNAQPPDALPAGDGVVIAIFSYASDTEANGASVIAPTVLVAGAGVDAGGNGPQAIACYALAKPAEAQVTGAVFAFSFQAMLAGNFPESPTGDHGLYRGYW